MTTTRVFQNGNSQALRIPQEMRTATKEFIIRKIGETFIAYPADDPWAPTRELLGSFPNDFLDARTQPTLAEIPEKEAM